MTDTMIRLLEDSFAEFDRLMTRVNMEIAAHLELSADHEVLMRRQVRLQQDGASFVAEAAMALKDVSGDLDQLPRRPFPGAAAASAGLPPGRSNRRSPQGSFG